jgi:hypothetical protein
METNPLTARLLQRLIHNHTNADCKNGREFLEQIASELNSLRPDTVISAGCAIFTSFMEKGILLGVRP